MKLGGKCIVKTYKMNFHDFQKNIKRVIIFETEAVTEEGIENAAYSKIFIQYKLPRNMVTLLNGSEV